MSSYIYQIRDMNTDQILKAGTIRLTTTYRKGWVGKGINPKTAIKKIEKVAETHNIAVRDLEMTYYEQGA